MSAPRPEASIRDFLHARAFRARRLVNERLAAREFAEGAEILGALPSNLNIETTTYCNLKCVMCPHGNDAMPERAHLETATIERLSRFLPLAGWMEIHGIGEPLLSPSFWTTLDSLRPMSGVRVSINSNGTLLTGERIDRILGSPLTCINISLDAARPETYARIRGGSFAQVTGNVRELVRRRDQAPRRKLSVLLNMTLMRENIEELSEFVDLASDLGVDRIVFWHLNDGGRSHAWTTTKGSWEFSYEKQLLRHCPELANRMVASAVRRAKEKNVSIHWDAHRSVLF